MTDRAYISGGISGVPDYQDRFAVADQMVFGMGLDPVNPLAIQACPDDQCFGDQAERFNGHTWSCWLRHDLIELLRCGHIFMLPGWQYSQGARLEMRTALDVGINIHFLNPSRFNYLLDTRKRHQAHV